MKSSREVIRARQNRIINLLKNDGKQSVATIAELMAVTPATVRRDLIQLEQSGSIIRSFGSAEYFAPYDMRDVEPTNIEDEKVVIRRRIAKAAAELVEDGDVMFLNSSGTASLVLDYLADKHVTIFTNNARIVNRPRTTNLEVVLLGGEIYGKKQSLVGQFTLETISHVTASKCILGVDGISAEGGLTSVILPETPINTQMLRQCRGTKMVVAESSKVGLKQNFFSGDINSINYLITDHEAEAQSVQAIEEAGIHVVRV